MAKRGEEQLKWQRDRGVVVTERGEKYGLDHYVWDSEE